MLSCVSNKVDPFIRAITLSVLVEIAPPPMQKLWATAPELEWPDSLEVTTLP